MNHSFIVIINADVYISTGYGLFDSAGININDSYFGRWVMGGGNGGHQSWSYKYNKLWERYINNHPIPDANDIIDYFNKLNGVR